MRRAYQLVPLLFVVATSACQPKPVSLAGTWPSQAGDYDSVTEKWTRQARVRGDIDEHLTEIAAVSATLLAPEWRVAYVQKRIDDEKLPPAKANALLAAQRERDEAYYEVMLLMRAYERRLIDFEKGDRSVWRVVLTDGRGNEIEATEFEKDRRLRSVIAEFFPDLGDFERPYLVRFPRDELELFGEGAEEIHLVISSPRATMDLVWEDD